MQQITLADGCRLEAIGKGVVTLKLKLPGGKSKAGRLGNVPDLAYSLLSVPKITEVGKEITFDEAHGHIRDDQGDMVAVASKVGSLYYLNCEPFDNSSVNSTATSKVNRLSGISCLDTWENEDCSNWPKMI